MLRPGDALVHKRFTKFAPGPWPTSWKTALVISVDHGKMPYETSDGHARPAGCLLLVTGPTFIQRDFTWIARYYDNVERCSDVP